MQRALRVSQLWAWLPAFRTVAETEHLPTAARMLALSPSALSRSVKQLEDSLGEALFTREGRRLKINRAGELLLVAVRDAMRMIDDGIERTSTSSIQRIRIAGALEWVPLLVLPALEDREANAGISVDIAELAAPDIPAALLRGEVDLAICEAIRPSDRLLVECLGEVQRAVCWSDRLRDDRGLPFAVCTSDGADESLVLGHGDVVLRTPSLGVAIAACRAGSMRAILPTAIARASQLQSRGAALRVSQLYLVQRSPLTESPFAPLVTRIKAAAGTVLRSASRVEG